MPTEQSNSTPRANFLSRMGQSARNFYNRQMQGLRNAVPGTGSFSLMQAADVLSEPFFPGNFVNSQAAGGARLQFPGQDTAQRALAGMRGMLGPGLLGGAEAGVGAGAENMTVSGSGQAGVGAGASAGGSAFGSRPQLDTFMLMSQMPGAAAEREYWNMIMRQAPRHK
jgi:hypothetical protein